MADKVKYGIKNVHYALLTNDTPTYETPVPIPGAVSFSLEASGDTTPYYADDMQYFVTVANNGYTGDLEMALFPDKFLEDVFGFTASTKDKVITENATNMFFTTALVPDRAGLWQPLQKQRNRKIRRSV